MPEPCVTPLAEQASHFAARVAMIYARPVRIDHRPGTDQAKSELLLQQPVERLRHDTVLAPNVILPEARFLPPTKCRVFCVPPLFVRTLYRPLLLDMPCFPRCFVINVLQEKGVGGIVPPTPSLLKQ
jgi:hypothetical protein